MKPLVFFYLLVIYVILQFSWWAYLLIDLNKEVYSHKIEMAERYESGNVAEYTQLLNTKLRERWIMVAGEGAVFLAILVFGIYKTREAFRKEFALSRQQKNFLLSITHEFKSPLAAVKLNLQTLQKRALSKDQQSSIITKSIAETDRINNLIENALVAARIDSHNFNLQQEEFNLTECVQSTVQSREIPGDSTVKYNLSLQPDIYIRGDALAITSLLLNLLDNAEKYAPESSEIDVGLVKEKNYIIISVADRGIGIPENEKQKIFEKFYRVGNEETRKTKGTGLGLFIVKYIANYHRGEVKVFDNKPAGTIFKVILPAV